MDKEKRIHQIERRLLKIAEEKKQLMEELEKLRLKESHKAPPLLGTVAAPKPPLTPKEKIDLFLRLFRCRKNVYPKLWENSEVWANSA